MRRKKEGRIKGRDEKRWKQAVGKWKRKKEIQKNHKKIKREKKSVRNLLTRKW